MMRARFFCLGLLAGMFALLADCAVANALSITQTQSFNLATPLGLPDIIAFHVSNAPNPNPPPSITITNTNNASPANPLEVFQLLTFNRFDTTLGTLTGVTITFTTVYGATVTVTASNENDDTVPAPADFFADATIGHSLTGSGFISPASTPQLLSAGCLTNRPPPDDVTDCNDSQSSNNNPFGNNTALSLAPGADFTGPGIFNLTATLTSALAPRVNPDNGTSFADNSTFDGTLIDNWSGSVKVEYTYDPFVTPVPEPLSLYLLAAGLGGIVLSRRRRR